MKYFKKVDYCAIWRHLYRWPHSTRGRYYFGVELRRVCVWYFNRVLDYKVQSAELISTASNKYPSVFVMLNSFTRNWMEFRPENYLRYLSWDSHGNPISIYTPLMTCVTQLMLLHFTLRPHRNTEPRLFWMIKRWRVIWIISLNLVKKLCSKTCLVVC